MTTRPLHLADPVCGMTVEVAKAEVAGLLLELDGRTYGFCRSGCRRAFLEEPNTYVAQAEAEMLKTTVPARADELLVIDDGMRRWYESCSCCLSEAYPEIKAQLDAERAAALAPPVDAGICEVAEDTNSRDRSCHERPLPPRQLARARQRCDHVGDASERSPAPGVELGSDGESRSWRWRPRQARRPLRGHVP